ncbi:MAG: translocation/assembly module TamB domain-containing protein [Candidatus Marinimicrobia bacterium]|nr:translocation/assembly module TamB domain-containing protein [Candidatus Neomarinimicrobiota bacterium]
MRLLRQGMKVLGKALVVLVVAAFSIVLFSPNVIARYLQALANRVYLNPIGYRLSFEGFKGDILGTMEFASIAVVARDGRAAFEARNASLNIDLLRLIQCDLKFGNIFIDSLHARLPASSGEAADRIPLENFPWVSIDNLNIGSLVLETTEGTLWARINGGVDLTDQLRLDDGSIEFVYGAGSDTVKVKASRLLFDGSVLKIRAGGASYQGHQVVLDGSIKLLPEIEFDLKIASGPISGLALLPEWLRIDGIKGAVQGTPDEILLDLALQAFIAGRALDLAEGRIVIEPDRIKLGQVVLALGSEKIIASGELGLDGSGILMAHSSHVNPAHFAPLFPELILDGSLTIESFAGKNPMDTLSIELDLNSISYLDQQVAATSGKLWKYGDQWRISDTLKIELAGADIELWGQYDGDRGLLDLEVFLHTDSLGLLMERFDLPLVSGIASGQMWVSGHRDAPTFTGAMTLSSTVYAGLSAGQGFVQFVVDSATIRPRGFLQASMGDIDLRGIEVEGAELELIFAGDTVGAKYLRLYQGFDRLATSGYVILGSPFEIVLDTLSLTRNTESLVSGPLVLQASESGVVELSHSVSIAGGTVALTGEVTSAGDLRIHWEANQVDLERVYRLLDRPAANRGILTSTGELSKWDNKLSYSGRLQVSEGAFGTVPFKSVASHFALKSRTLVIDTLRWEGYEGSWQTAGTFHYREEPEAWSGLGAVDHMSLEGRFDQYEINEWQTILPWTLETRGLLSGSFTASGLPLTPRYVADLILTAPQFDLIRGQRLSVHLEYEDNVLRFKDLAMRTDGGNYTGGGTMPVELSPVAEAMTVLADEPVDLLFKGASTQLEFITPYFDQIDLLKGDYRMELALGGTFNQLIRNGWMEARNGTIELLPMENPVTNLEGRAILSDNILTIANLTAKTPKFRDSDVIGVVSALIGRLGRNGGNAEDLSHIEVTGSLDMTEFFSPVLDLQLTGEQVYFASPLREIEAIGSARFTITGKDTIAVEGTFIPDPGDLAIKSELTGPESYAPPEDESGVLFMYNIRVPFYGGAVVRNSEIDVEIEGEITLTAVGSEEFRYAGNVEIVSGGFDFNGYNFSVLEGSVQFEPSEFNPQFYIRAVTDIDIPTQSFTQGGETQYRSDEVTLTLAGKLDEPNVNLQSDLSAYTQSDLLQLFALGNTSLATTGATTTATWSLGNFLLREIERDAQRAVGLDRLQILTGGGGALPGVSSIRINMGKRLSSKLYVGIGADPTLSFDQYQYRIAYRLNRNMSLEGSIDPATGLTQANFRIKYRY